MIALDLFEYDTQNQLIWDITKYANSNVECIVRVLIDLLEDNNDFDADDFLPYNNLRIKNEQWVEMVYDLYDIVRSDVIRNYIKPKYEYLLYVILQWWEDCSDSAEELLPQKLDCTLLVQIQSAYTGEDGFNGVLKSITNFDDYYYILFADHDFLPRSLENLTVIYLNNPPFFNEFFAGIDLKEYQELMPKDLQEQFIELSDALDKVKKTNFCEEDLLNSLLFCCERIQSNNSFKDFSEDSLNDIVRDLLNAQNYNVRDQTRQGTSSSGIQSGEVDILIRKDELPFAVFEALKLSSVDTAYISEHIDKIYSYDTSGNTCNFIVSYVKTKNFGTFWDKYKNFVASYSYPFPAFNLECFPDKQYSELRYAMTPLNRNGILTKLYHISVHIAD